MTETGFEPRAVEVEAGPSGSRTPVGTQAMKENLNDPGLVESVCARGDPERTKPCVGGMVGPFINHHGALEPARELCGRLETSNRDTCYQTVESRAPLFDS